MEAEYHGQLPCIPSRVLIAVLNGGAGHLTHGHDLCVRAECHVMEFFQIFMDVRAVCIILPPVPGQVILKHTLADQVHHVKAESLYAFVHPEPNDLLDLAPYIFIVPVQVRLRHIEKMQIIFIKLLHILPCASAELTLPVRRRAAVRFPLAEEEKILVVRVPFYRFLEPLMARGHMIENHIKHQPDAALIRLGDQLLHVSHRAVARIDIIIIFHIISIVILRRYKERRQPDIVSTKLFDIIQLPDHPAQISKSVLVRITERLRVNLINCTLPKIFMHNYSLLL